MYMGQHAEGRWIYAHARMHAAWLQSLSRLQGGESAAPAAAVDVEHPLPGEPAATNEEGAGGDVPFGPSRSGRLFRHEDERLGRPVLVERRESPVEGSALARLRALAAAGGPLVQRVLALSEDGRTVTYELISGARAPFAGLPPALAHRLRAAADAVTAARGNEEGPEALEVILSVGGPVIQVIDV